MTNVHMLNAQEGLKAGTEDPAFVREVGNDAGHLLALMQVQATLAVAEELHTANLIAAFPYGDMSAASARQINGRLKP